MQFGDAVESALKIVGITPERVSRWLGKPCRCTERKHRLNQLSRWASRILAGKTENAEHYLEQILDQ